MSKKMASVLIGYGVVLAGLGSLFQNIAPAIARVTFIAGLAGGGLCLLWGLAALAGLKGRAWAVLTMIAVAFVLLHQTVNVWMASAGENSASLTVRLLVVGLLVLTISTLMYLFHGERPPEFYQKAATRNPDSCSSRNETQMRDTRAKR